MKNSGAYYTFENIIGNNKELKKTVDFAHKVALNNSSVLLLGETGTGKELFAQSIHNASRFSNGPFIAVNCAAIPSTLIESILFGTSEGAFTGAKNTKGLLHQAHNGTLFLDEINSMNLDAQSKLLRFLQDKIIRSLGDNKQTKIHCRIISAINKSIEDEIDSGNIRSDLYYRLSTVTIRIPPLSQRIDDIPILSNFFINKYKSEFRSSVKKIDPFLIDSFRNYNWPGNVRELEHVIESAMNMIDSDEEILKQNHLSTYLQQRILSIDTCDKKNSPNFIFSNEKKLHVILDDVERQVIIERLSKNQGNITQTAEDLGIFRQALQYRIKKYKIEKGEYM